eukprot:3671450-Rhodomonas_salina.2
MSGTDAAYRAMRCPIRAYYIVLLCCYASAMRCPHRLCNPSVGMGLAEVPSISKAPLSCYACATRCPVLPSSTTYDVLLPACVCCYQPGLCMLLPVCGTEIGYPAISVWY